MLKLFPCVIKRNSRVINKTIADLKCPTMSVI